MANTIDLPYPAENWSVQDVNQYNKLPYYFTKDQVRYLKSFNVHQKMLGTWNWQARNGTTARSVRKEPSPILRSTFIPQPITSTANRDVINLQEMTEDAKVYHHKVESMYLHYLNDYQDFEEHASKVNEDITEKISLLPELFYRTAIFEGSPYVYVCGYGLVNTDYWKAGNIATAKTPGIIQDLINRGIKPISCVELDRAKQVMGSDLGAIPQTGNLVKGGGKNENSNDQHWTLVGGKEIRDNLKYDPFVLANRPLAMNVLNQGFTGPIAEDIDFLPERFELRYLIDNYLLGNGSTAFAGGTAPPPQTFEANPNAWNYGQTSVQPAYSSAPIGVAFLYGDTPYKAIKPGPPPSAFAGSSFDMDKFQGLDWNGKVRETRNLLIKTADGNWDTNKYGELAQYIAYLTMGIFPSNRKNVLPIIYARSRAGSTMKR